MQPIIKAIVANSERMRLFFGFGRPSVGELLRINWKIAVPMVATAPMMAARMVSERPMRYGSVFPTLRAAARGYSEVCTGSHFGLEWLRERPQARLRNLSR